jgi:hypothetical protein
MRCLRTNPKETSQLRAFGHTCKRLFVAGTVSLGLSSVLLGASAMASRLPNNRVVFDRSPEFIEATVLPAEQAENGQFQIVISLPETAGEAMEALVVHPRDTGICFPFDPTGTEAYIGKADAELAAIPLASVGGMMMSPNEVLVVFATPIEPGQQVTVRLQPKFSPIPGIYEFGVTAYPTGDSPVGQFLGYERLQF